MFGQLNKKTWTRIIALVVTGVFLFSSVANASVISEFKLKPKAATDGGDVGKFTEDLASSSRSNRLLKDGGLPIPLQKTLRFKTGYEPVNPNHVVDNFAVKATVMTAATLQDLRGAALGLDKKKDKDKISKIKDAADGLAKRVYEEVVKGSNIILVVRVSEGFGRDELAESLKANEVITPDELRGELEGIRKAVEDNFAYYTSKAGREYRIKSAIIDVIEGTNPFVYDVDGKKLEELDDSEAGATSTIVISDSPMLGNCPDIYVDGIFTMVPKAKRQEFIDNPLDPELTAKDSSKVGDVLTRITDANGISINDLEVVLLDRTREAERLAVLKELQKKYPSFKITVIKDGTLAPSLVANFGKKEGKHKVVMTTGGSPEGFLNVAVASIFKNEGALASVRLFSKNINKTPEGEDSKDLSRRYDFSDSEKEELRTLRRDDAEDIIKGNKLFTQEDVRGEVEGSFSFITHNGVFNTEGVKKVDDKSRVNLIRVGTINGKPGVWFSEKIIDPKDVSKAFVDSIPADQPLLSFADTQAVYKALQGIVEVTPTGVRVINKGLLRGFLIDNLVYDATFNPNPEVVALTRKLIKDIAAAQGAVLKSVYYLYLEKAKDPTRYTVPAINIRGMAYNSWRAAFESAIANNVGVVIPEIAKSEIKYTAQRPAEYATSVLAAAIKEGYKQPIFLQGDHFQISLDDYRGNPEKGIIANPDKAREDIKKLIREAIGAGFYQIDLDMSPLVDWSKSTPDEQQKDNYTETAILTAYVRALERELGLDKLDIVSNLGGEIGEIGKGLEKGKERNSNVEDLIAFDDGYKRVSNELSEKAGYEIKPTTKIAVQTGTKHGGIRDDKGKVVKAKVSFNTLAELGKATRDRGYAGTVQHGASTLDPRCFVVFAGNPVPHGFDIPPELLSEDGKNVLRDNPTAEVHLATAYQDTTLDHPAFPAGLLAEIEKYIKEKFPAKGGEDVQKAYIDNRKNAWGPFKLQVWNLPTEIQAEFRKSLKAQFDTVFTNLGVKDTKDSPVTAVAIWGKKLAPFAKEFPSDIYHKVPTGVMQLHKLEKGKVYPILINHEYFLKSPDGVMAFLNFFDQLGEGNIKPTLHMNRDDIKPEEVDKVADEVLAKINEINKGYTPLGRDMFAAVVVGTNPEEVAKQVQEKVGAGIFQVIGPEKYVKQFTGVIRIVLDKASPGQMTSVAKALKAATEVVAVVATGGQVTQEQLAQLDSLLRLDAQGDIHVMAGDVSGEVTSAIEEFQKQVEAAVRV